MKFGQTTQKGPAGVSPVKVTWKIKDGVIQRQAKEEVTVRALQKALASLIPPRGEKGDGFQYFVQGPSLYIESCSEAGPSGNATYTASGRALVGKTHMKTGAPGSDVCSFRLVFRETKDAHGLPDLEVVTGDIEPLPRGSTLF